MTNWFSWDGVEDAVGEVVMWKAEGVRVNQ